MVENLSGPIIVSFSVLFTALGGVVHMHFLKQGLTILLCSLGLLVILKKINYKSETALCSAVTSVGVNTDNNSGVSETMSNDTINFSLEFINYFILVLVLFRVLKYFINRNFFQEKKKKVYVNLFLIVVFVDVVYFICRCYSFGKITLILSCVLSLSLLSLFLLIWYYELIIKINLSTIANKFPNIMLYSGYLSILFLSLQDLFKLTNRKHKISYTIFLSMLGFLMQLFGVFEYYVFFLFFLQIFTEMIKSLYKIDDTFKENIDEKSRYLITQANLLKKKHFYYSLIVRHMGGVTSKAVASAGQYVSTGIVTTAVTMLAEGRGKTKIDEDFDEEKIEPVMKHNFSLKPNEQPIPFPERPGYTYGQGTYRTVSDVCENFGKQINKIDESDFTGTVKDNRTAGYDDIIQ